jgi:predicted kinase
MLVVFRGLPGTGKSYIARQVLERRPELLILSRDVLRRAIVPRPDFGSEEKSLIDDMIVSMADLLLSRGRSVLIDGMALSSAARVGQFARAARDRGAACRIIECRCSRETALARLRKDAGAHPAGDRGETLYFAVKASFQPIEEPFLLVDTDRDPAENLRIVLSHIDS